MAVGNLVAREHASLQPPDADVESVDAKVDVSGAAKLLMEAEV